MRRFLVLAAIVLAFFGLAVPASASRGHRPPPTTTTTTIPPTTSSTTTSTTTTTTTTTSTTTTTTTTVPPTTTTTIPAVPIATCPTLPGIYALTADQATCGITASGVTLDCGLHKIARLTVTNAANVHVANCTFTGVNDVYTSTQVQVTSSTFITNSVLQLHSTSQSLVSGNTFTADQTITGSVQLDDINGQNNVISQNTLDGAGAYVNSKAVGFDDGIFLAGASGDLVQGNHLAHYWDCGIETTNLVTNTTFSGNTVDSAPKALGAWYWSSWVNNTVQANTFTNVSFGWYMFNEYGPATQGTTVVYFTGNHFTNNTVSFDTSPNQPDVVIKVDVSEAPYYDPVTGQPITITPTVTASGNVFTGNNLGTVRFAPSLVPESAFVDGGGNICGPPPTALEPIHC